MKRLAAVAIAGLFFAGCASPYMIDRGRDAADILTATVSWPCYGLRARVGPIYAGLYGSADIHRYGLRGGEWLADGPPPGPFRWLGRLSGTVLLWSADVFAPPSVEAAPVAATREESDPRRKGFFVEPLWDWVPVHIRAEEKLEKYVAPPYYFTQIEASVGIYYGLRLGVNPGELLDFILGWTMLDIFGDDVAEEELKKPTTPDAKDGAG